MLLPEGGPLVINIAGVNDVALAPSTTGAEVRFRWPITCRLASLMLTSKDGLFTSLAAMRLRMVDDRSHELVIDGTGQVVSASMLGFSGIAPTLDLGLYGARIDYAFQRIITVGDVWTFQAFNDDGALTLTPRVGFNIARLD